ncbi:MAG: radical SAM protein [Candidatus Brocadiales bacterium]|nr:radical SAM protein [Candidatus Brocadiales bacterium]
MRSTLLKRLDTQRRAFSTRRFYNLFMGKVQHQLGYTRLYSLPSKINVESGNLCNLRCPLCPTGQHDPSAKKGLMPLETFKRVVDELGKNLTLLRLYNWGEPLLNPELVSMIEYASSRGIVVKISTNLDLKIDTGLIESLLRSGLHKIYVSCNSASRESYPIYHVGGDFDRVMENLRHLAEKCSLLDSPTKIVWLFHVFSHNEHEIERAREMARALGVKLELKEMRTDMGKEIFETAQEAIERDGKWLPKDPRYNIFDMERKRPKKAFNCDFLWTESVINWDGSVLPCCAVYSERYAFGNILEKPFKEIWNGELYQAARREVLSQENGTWTICRVCKRTGFLHG